MSIAMYPRTGVHLGGTRQQAVEKYPQMALTALQIQKAQPQEKDYKLFDGRGLHVLVKKNGSKYWRLKYRYAGKEKVLALGVYPEIDLKEARLQTDEARQLLRKDQDPTEVRKLQKIQKRASAESSFKSVALEWWEHQKGKWSDDHAQRVKQTLEREVFPYIGHRPISEILPPEVLQVVRKVESRDALDVAGRILQRSAAVFRYAVQTGRATQNPASELRGLLKTRKVQHRRSLPRSDLPEFLRKLRNYGGYAVTKYALHFLVLTFMRPGEIRFAEWSELDLENKVWRIPGKRMKMGADHLVPLSSQAIELLAELKPITGHRDYLFPGERSWKKPISENTMTYALYRMGYESRATPHGFRATASSILNEEGFNPDAIERQLSHAEKNEVRGAYSHMAEYLKDRARMMQWWADFLDRQETSSNVVPGKFGAV